MRKRRFFLLLVAVLIVHMVIAQSEIMSYKKLDDKTALQTLME